MMLRKVLLICGIAASVLQVVGDIVASRRYSGYSYANQTISELGAIGAPSRPLVLSLGFVWDALMIAFGVGVWRSAGRKRALRGVAGLVAGLGAFGVTAPFTSMHKREVLAAGGGTVSDTLHLVGAGVGSLFWLLSIGFGAASFGGRFRLYSVGTILTLLLFGSLTSARASRVQANLPTPSLGIEERIMFFSSWLWFAVLAIALLRARGASVATRLRKPIMSPQTLQG
jgi:hypothetical protein